MHRRLTTSLLVAAAASAGAGMVHAAADAPDLAGSLTPWHDHQNLCWDPSGIKLAGIVINGKCRPGGTFRPTAPMMHVWLTEPPCGPFSGVEGHGAVNCAHTHDAA